MKYIVSLLYPIMITLFSLFVFNIPQIKQLMKQNWKLLLYFLLASFIFGNFFLYFHLSQEQYIYFWDFSGFWRKTVEFNRSLDKSVMDTLKLTYESMLYQEYSFFPEWFLSLPIMILGEYFPRFVVSMFNFFVMPANIMLALIALWIKEKLNIKEHWFVLLAFSFIILFTGNILPMKLGYIGSAGLPFIGLIILCLLSLDFEERQILPSIFIGLNLVIIVLVRRWFSYVAVSFFVAYPLAYLIKHLINRTFEKEKVINFGLNILMMGLTALMILVIGFFPLFKTFITYDYQLAYQSAKVGGYLYAIEWFKTYYSPLISILFIYGFIEGMINERLRQLTMFLGFSVVIVIYLFYRIQVFGSHHYYIINMYTMTTVLIGFAFLSKRIHRKLKFFVSFFLIIAMSANFGLLFIKREGTLLNHVLDAFIPISTSLYYPPRYRDDVDTIRDISTYLDYTPSAGEYVYVLAGSANFTDDVLRNAWFPEKLNSVRNIEPTMQLDTRDGIPKMFFKYTYIVVTDPIQYHNGEDYQKVIGILADGMLNDEELRSHYKLEKTFTIIDGIKVYIYKLIEDIPKEIIDKYREKFRSVYPDYPFLYEFNY